MTIEEFAQELKLIDKDLNIRPNTPPAKVAERFPDTIKIASIVYKGSEICSIPNFDIYDEPNGSYGVDLRQDGRFIPHRTRPEALRIVKETLHRLQNDKEYYNDFFGLGSSSEAALRSNNEEPMAVEEVSADASQVQSGMLEAPHE